jgi:dGTPase
VDWTHLLNTNRRRPSSVPPDPDRNEFERDYDRLLFSAPVRRLADKTQVFPLEEHDSVRTRLTHSLEVSNLARSLGLAIARRLGPRLNLADADRLLSSILASAALVHDIGNPPFGHQGEVAIQSWFANHPDVLSGVDSDKRQDFLRFEGNAQALRILMRLQILDDDTGLNLTYATLAVLMKYTVAAHEAVGKTARQAALRKPGYFFSEAEVVQQIRAECKLGPRQRHPLTFVVEACDDIAYATVDAEDAVKKGLASLPDLVAHLKVDGPDPVVDEVIDYCNKEQEKARHTKLVPSELNDILMQKFRTFAIGKMVPIVRDSFMQHLERIENAELEGDLIDNSPASELRRRLKEFDGQVAYAYRGVIRVEAQGERVIHALMSELWSALSTKPGARTSRMKYAMSRVSKNYLRVYDHAIGRVGEDYARAQLLADMIAGMTDGFAVALHKDFEELSGK